MDSQNNKIEQSRQLLRNLSSQAFLSFGMNQISYVRPVVIDNRRAFALHAADGTPLTVIDTFEGAIIAARQNDLEPVTLQ